VADGAGVFAYQPSRYALQEMLTGDIRAQLQDAALGQESVGVAPVCFVIVAIPKELAARYGDRALRYSLLAAGHAAQNLLLQATALGLGGVPIGAFHDKQVSRLLKLAADVQPVYLVPVGYPRASAFP
jgi:SagB-type dehydrogenase family enzyme